MGLVDSDASSCASIDRIVDCPFMLVPGNSEWRYWAGVVAPAQNWPQPDFDDSGWAWGPSSFGYGYGGLSTVLASMRGSYSSLYLRRDLELVDPAEQQDYCLRVVADGGIVVYINGMEVGRANVGNKREPVLKPAEASEDISDASEHTFELSTQVFRRGRNVIAIRGVNASLHSDDFLLLPILECSLNPNAVQERFDKRLHQRNRRLDKAGRAYLEGRLLQKRANHTEAIQRFKAAMMLAEKPAVELRLRLVESLRCTSQPALAAKALAQGLEQLSEHQEVLLRKWLEVQLVDLSKDALGALSDFPVSSTGGAGTWPEDCQWALSELATFGAIRVNCGGEQYGEAPGKVWARDRLFCGGQRFSGDSQSGASSPFTADIAGTVHDPLFQTERWFPLKGFGGTAYEIPLPKGLYRVTLLFSEIFFKASGSRRFDVLLEGKRVLTGYEPLRAGYAVSDQHSFEALVDDGFLSIGFAHVQENPKISAFEVVPMN